MSTGFNPDRFDQLLKSLRSRFEAFEPAPLDLVSQFVYSFLLWEAGAAEAERVFRRIAGTIVDFNDLRICLPDEIVEMIGPRYPRVEERAMRLRVALNELYVREHSVSFDRIKDSPKRESRQYVETLEGVPPFVAGRMALLGFGGHACPLDERGLAALISEDVFEPDTPLDRASASLERHVKAAQGVETHILLMQHREEIKPAPKPKSPRRKKR